MLVLALPAAYTQFLSWVQFTIDFRRSRGRPCGMPLLRYLVVDACFSALFTMLIELASNWWRAYRSCVGSTMNYSSNWLSLWSNSQVGFGIENVPSKIPCLQEFTACTQAQICGVIRSDQMLPTVSCLSWGLGVAQAQTLVATTWTCFWQRRCEKRAPRETVHLDTH